MKVFKHILGGLYSGGLIFGGGGLIFGGTFVLVFEYRIILNSLIMLLLSSKSAIFNKTMPILQE